MTSGLGRNHDLAIEGQPGLDPSWREILGGGEGRELFAASLGSPLLGVRM